MDGNLIHPDNLAFTMVGADGIRAADDNGRSDPFVVIDVLDAASETRSVVKEVADAWASEQDRVRKNMWKPPKKHQYRTKTIQATLSPRWNENFDLPLRYMIKPFRPIKLRFTAFDEDVVGNNDFLGFAELAINSIEDCLNFMMGDVELSLPFGPRPNNQKDELEYYKAKKDFGTMHLRVRMEGCENFEDTVTRSMGMSMHVNKLVVCVVAAARLKTAVANTRPVVEFDASGNVEKSAHPKGTAHVTQQALRSSKSTDPTWQPNERFSLFLKAKKKGPTTVKMTVRSGPGGKFLGYYELVLDEKMLATMVGRPRLSKFTLRTRGEDHPDHHEGMVLLLDPKNKGRDLGELRVHMRACAAELEEPEAVHADVSPKCSPRPADRASLPATPKFARVVKAPSVATASPQEVLDKDADLIRSAHTLGTPSSPVRAASAMKQKAAEAEAAKRASAARAAQLDSLSRNVKQLVSAVQHQQDVLQTQRSQHEALLAEQRAQHEAFAEKQLQRQQELLAEQQAALQKQFADQLAEQQALLAEQLEASQKSFFERQEQLLSPLRERAAPRWASPQSSQRSSAKGAAAPPPSESGRKTSCASCPCFPGTALAAAARP